MSALLTVGVGVAVALISAELLAWFPWVAVLIVSLAVRLVPLEERARWLEEWLAEMESLPGLGLSKLLFAVSIGVGAARIGYERRGTRVSVHPPRQPFRQGALDDLHRFALLLLLVIAAWQLLERKPQHQSAGLLTSASKDVA